MSTKREELYLELQKSYDDIAAGFSATRERVWQDLALFEPWLEKGLSVLDVGCGNGRLAPWCLDLGMTYTGIDNSGKLIELAKKAQPDVPFYHMDGLNMTFPDASFDCVLSVAVLNHFPTRELQTQLLQEMYRVLKPNGVLLLSNWNLWNVHSKKGLAAFNRAKDSLTDEQFMAQYGVPKQTLAERDVITVWNNQSRLYYYAFDAEELATLVKSIGFHIITSEYAREGKPAPQPQGTNILTIARK